MEISVTTKPPRTIREVYDALPEGTLAQLIQSQLVMSPAPTYDGILPTDQIFGEEVTISVTMPATYRENFTILVRNVIHGIDKGELEVRDYGDSEGDCENNIHCSLGIGWEEERDAVCRFITGETGGTGTLLNNGCQNIRPFILTANHVLQSEDADPLNYWVFRFNYDSPSTTCHGHNGEPSTWISFYGANFRASWADTDFALIELKNSIIGYTDLTLAGWDRSTNVPGPSTIIHHPSLDVKKITIDAGTAVIDDNLLLGIVADHGFIITLSNGQNGDDGITEGGSSGAALFNEFQRVVGNNVGGGVSTCTNTVNKTYGRFFNSWTGGGTNNTRLSNWLGGNGDPITTNTIRVPGLTGVYAICDNNNHTYQVLNPIPGKSISWSVSPTSLFSGSTSGTGSMATLKKATNAHG